MHSIRFELRFPGVAVVLVLALGTRESRAQSVPVSPTGIPYTVPAAARAAVWTLAATQARTALFGSNPAFLAGGTRYEIALTPHGSSATRTSRSSPSTNSNRDCRPRRAK